MKRKTLTITGIALCLQASGQMPTSTPAPIFPSVPGITEPALPQPSPFMPNITVGGQKAGATPNNPFQPSSHIQQQNQMIMQEVAQMEQMRQQQLIRQETFADAEREFKQREIKYELPDNSQKPVTELYRQAYGEITAMLEGKQPLDLKRAIFLTENAWYGNLDYEWFCYLVARETDALKAALQQEGQSAKNKDAVKWMLARFFSDTIGQHLPFKYDFDDPFGKEDWSKMFVTKLLTDRKGQCHSMPLVYLLLAEEMGVSDAWLSHSPNHSYIKLKNSKGNLYNFETTNGHYTSDTWILSSNFVKAEALKNGIYLDTMSKRELIASRLADLGMGYAYKFGYDKFVSQCAEKVLEYQPNNLQALQVEANYRTMLFGYVVWQLGYPDPKTIHEYPQAYELLRLRDEMYDKIDGIGFEQMPDEVYLQWLKSFENEKGKQPIEFIKP